MVENVTPLVITFDEAPNIRRVLDRLSWARRIVVVDSFSTDGTLEILKLYPRVEVFQRKFDTHASQWNYGLQQVSSEWVLSLDADYVLTDDFLASLASIPLETEIDVFFGRFKYCIFGKPLRATLLPPRAVLFRRERAIYVDDGHTQLLQAAGAAATLGGFIYHDDRKAIGRWLWAQDRYMKLESQKLRGAAKLGIGDRLRRTKVLAPFVVLFYCLFLQKGLLDGWAGWYYALQRTLAEILLAIQLIEDENLNPSPASVTASGAAQRTGAQVARADTEIALDAARK